MSNNPFGDEELDPAWGISGPSRTSDDDVLRDALKKEELIKDIQAAQADLRAFVERVYKTQDEVDKLVASNGMLQTYIDNMSKQMSLTRR